MGIETYAKSLNTKVTPQTEPIPGKPQVKNSASGFTFAVSDWTRLERFLILGSEGWSYYASEKKLTKDNAEGVIRCIKADGPKTVQTIIEVSDGGRAPKNDPAIFALALCLKLGDVDTKRLAVTAVPKVCRIGTHIFSLAEVVKGLGGWGRLTKKAFTTWYTGQNADQLAMNVAKYQSRNGWSHRDLLRKLRPTPANDVQKATYRWAVGKTTEEELTAGTNIPAIIQGFEKAKKAGSVAKVVKLIEEYGLPRECIPTEHLNSVEVWDALLTSGKGMPMTAMIRNLGKMTEVGLIKPLSKATKYIVGRLENAEELKKARVHPISVLMALSTYRSGHGLKGSLTWQVDQNIVDGLDSAFYKAFDAVEPTGKRFLLALDVSGSMASGNVGGSGLTPRDASAAMALLTAKTEKWNHVIGFGFGGGYFRAPPKPKKDGMDGITQLDISPKMRLPEAIAKISNLPFGSTDCSLPMEYAIQQKLEVDAFVVYTDSETYAGARHPVQALQAYRQQTGIDSKLIVVGMVSNGFSIADPNDPGMLDVVGFDTNVPAIMADFVKQSLA